MKPNTLTTLKQQLAQLSDANCLPLLISGYHVGLEKEALRVNQQAEPSSLPHPQQLGSALTHPYITTDYSEALLEMVTPPLNSGHRALSFLENLHSYIHQRLAQKETLWANSMPCVMKEGQNIPVAQYGSSNLGRMKTIYRIGLGHRYGRAMQAISGVHFNYSFNPELWQHLNAWHSVPLTGKSLQAHFYMAVARNLLRISWVIPYLFGASPAICKTFVHHQGDLQSFDSASLYKPYATSLRMGDIGYQNNQEVKFGVQPAFNTLSEYIASLKYAISTPCPPYQAFGIKVDGDYRQLNANILQLENENYMSVRLKNIGDKDEMPLRTLHRYGINYIELRSLDVNPFYPAGITLQQLNFLEILMIFCVLKDSPPMTTAEYQCSRQNEILVAQQGRQPNLQLHDNNTQRRRSEWGETLCEYLSVIAEQLDKINRTNTYRQAVATQQGLFNNPDATPSARMLDEMSRHQESFAAFAWRKSREFHTFYLQQTLPDALVVQWDQIATSSRAKQKHWEQHDVLSLDAYIKHYFAQINDLHAHSEQPSS